LTQTVHPAAPAWQI